MGYRDASNHQPNRSTLPHQWTLIIDTCCLVNDNGAEAKRLINHATLEAVAREECIGMVRQTLGANIAANNKRNVLRSQTILESREAAAEFLPKDYHHPTNDDHILACALLENERARRKSATPCKIEVIL